MHSLDLQQDIFERDTSQFPVSHMLTCPGGICGLVLLDLYQLFLFFPPDSSENPKVLLSKDLGLLLSVYTLFLTNVITSPVFKCS